jgi:hypothetical protein
MSNPKLLELDIFLKYHQEFIEIPTWTKAKRTKHDELTNYLDSCSGCYITSSRDSDTTKVHLTNAFTIFKVPTNQRGYMMKYRDKWVLMYMKFRLKFQHFLEVFPLEKGIEKEFSLELKKRLNYYYIDSLK